ncbi:MAG TPA: SET domain-containing protein-lysine N-methyltransferase [Hanamia sp.]|nr:SET domain-containing protein-lysine N-methyltransferase [Hanamia sp.]
MIKVCVLQPDYSTSDVDYKNYDPPRYLATLLPECETDHVFLNKLSVYRQLRELKKKKYDVFVNLCEGYLDWSVPSIDVIHCLELLNLPYTGPNAVLYDPSKELMKYVAFCCGVNTPAYIKVTEENANENITSKLKFPLFIKPAKAGDSLGIDDDSLVNNETKLFERIHFLLKEYDEILVEEYIAGREFTVLVAANAGSNDCTVYTPLEFVFPEGKKFKTYSLKTSELHKECNIACKDEYLSKQLKLAASKIFKEFNGVGYARMDFRVNDKMEIFFLEINFTCSVFYEDGYEGSADYVLMHEPGGKRAFLEHIIAEGIYRHQKKQKKYFLKGNAISGYGIYANKNISKDEIIFQNEGKPHRLITKKYVDKNWNAEEINVFRKYAWPVGNDVYVLWDEDPTGWAPQNHSCEPNTEYVGLNVIAYKNIKKGEELTLDYTTFLNDEMESFICNCGAPNCKKIIQGVHPASLIHLKKREL